MSDTRQLYAEFDPARYHRVYYSQMDPEVEFFLQRLHHTFKEGLSGRRGRSVLDVGCGPTITAVLSASASSESITLADLVPANRDAVSAWLAKTDGRLDWTPHLAYVASLEGDELTPSQLADRVRRKVKRVIPVDVLQESPLGTATPDRFDVVVSSLCLEFAASDLVQYQQTLKNIATLLKTGGHLVMQGALGNSFYLVEEERFPSVSLTHRIISEALRAAGLSELQWHQIPRQCPLDKMADHTGCFFVLARKTD